MFRLHSPSSPPAIIALGREPGDGLVVMPDTFLDAHRAPIIAAARNKVPAVYWRPDFAREGGLLSYGVDQVDTFRRTVTYVDRILRGAKPSELPVQLPTKFEMILNLKTAMQGGANPPYSAATCAASMNSSARSRIDGGIARPSAVAVLRFRTISNLVGN